MAVSVYEWCKTFFPIGAVSINQMKRFVQKGKLTEAQYKEITYYTYPEPLDQ